MRATVCARAALFDLDGTLLDTAPDLAAALNALLAEERRGGLALSAVRPHVSNGAVAVIRAGFPELDRDGADLAGLHARFLDHYRAGLAVHTRLFPGFESVLVALQAQRIPWGIVTNKPAWLTEPLLEQLGLRARAACVFSGDTLPERKPHPRPLLEAAHRIGALPAECVYLGDALRDVQAARAAGMVALGARYGYLNAADEPERWPVTAWLDSPGELLPWLGMAVTEPPRP